MKYLMTLLIIIATSCKTYTTLDLYTGGVVTSKPSVDRFIIHNNQAYFPVTVDGMTIFIPLHEWDSININDTIR